MALKISKPKDDKIITYWRIVRAYFNTDEKHLIIELRGYENKQKSDEAKAGTKTQEFVFQFTFSGAEFPDVSKDILKEGYKLIKTKYIYDTDWSQSVEV